MSRYWAKLRWGISDFQISFQFFINKNCHIHNQSWYWHKTWTSNQTWQVKHINVKKIWQWSYVSKLWRHCLFSNLWPICSHPDAGYRLVLKCKFYKLTFLKLTFYFCKIKAELKNLKDSLYTIALSKGTNFAKNTDFSKKNADISKIKGVLVLKGIFLYIGTETAYARARFYQVLSF